MFAVISSGSKQYKVKAGDLIKVEKLDVAAGETIDISDVLLLSDESGKVTVGQPIVEGAKVVAKVNLHGRGPKVTVVKFLRRKHHLKRMGSRQSYTELSILDISLH